MEAWQFSLFFAALLVGYLLLHLRVVRFEEHLRGLATLRSIDDRLASLQVQLPTAGPVAVGAEGANGAAAAAEALPRIEAQLQRLHEDLEDLRETVARASEQLGEAIVRIPQPGSGSAEAGPAAAVTAGERVRAVVETRLLQMGFSSLRLLTDLQHATLDGDVEVQVEAERRHMPVKGRVLVRNGAIRDIAMQTVAPTFP